MGHRARTRRLGALGLAVIALVLFAAAGVIPGVEMYLSLAERMLLYGMIWMCCGFIYWGWERG